MNATPTVTVPAIPLLCGPLHQLLGQTGYPGYCERSHRLYRLHTWWEGLQGEAARVAKLRSPRRAANLTAYVVEEQDRLSRITAKILGELAPCTHVEDERGELTPDEALPDCTC